MPIRDKNVYKKETVVYWSKIELVYTTFAGFTSEHSHFVVEEPWRLYCFQLYETTFFQPL
jgi:hypothetical protein